MEYLNVNTSKTNIVVFRNRGKLQRKDVWLHNNEVLDIVDEFNYLGMMFNSNGKFLKQKSMHQNRVEKLCFQYVQV